MILLFMIMVGYMDSFLVTNPQDLEAKYNVTHPVQHFQPFLPLNKGGNGGPAW